MAKESKTSSNKYFQNINYGIDNVNFELTGVHTSVANTLRRCILSEIPTYGFEDEPKKVFSLWKHNSIPIPKGIKITENTSSLHNEFLSHRIGLIPIYCRKPIFSEFNKDICDRVFSPSLNLENIRKLEDRLMAIPHDSDEREIVEEMLRDEREMPLFKLDITNNNSTRKALKNGKYFESLGRKKKVKVSSNNILSVTSDMFHTEKGDELDYIKYDPVIYENFTVKGDDGSEVPREEYAIIVTLKPGIDNDGQTLKAEVRPNPGIARYHSKYCPVGTVSYSFKRDEDPNRIRSQFEKLLTQTNRTRLMKGLEPLETDIFDADGELVSDVNVEVRKLWNNFQILDRDKIYELDGSTPKYFVFNVESTGSLEPYQIVHDALYMLRLKLIDLFNNVNRDEGNEYIEITRSSGVMRGVDITINNENHTMGNIITHALNDADNIDFAGYKMPHPLHEKIVFRITLHKTDNLIEDTIVLFKDTIHKLIKQTTELIDEWKGLNSDVYTRLIDNTTEEFLNNDTKSTMSVSSKGSKKSSSSKKDKLKLKPRKKK